MHNSLVTLALLAGSGSFDPQAGFDSLPQAASAIASTLQTGSLLFSSGDCLAVRIYTASPYTHVATVVVTDSGERWVYDTTNGVGVRRLPLADYLAMQAPAVIHVHHPTRSLSAEQRRAYVTYLDSQLGRPYAVQHHLTGQRRDGLHCSEYVTDALMAIELLHARQPARVSPASLQTGITQHDVYTAGESIRLQRPAPPPPQGETACEQIWLDTKSCCRDCCRQLRGWFCCE